jgi:Methyltransferase domain
MAVLELARNAGLLTSLRNGLLNCLKPIHREMRDRKVDLLLRFAGDLPIGARLLDVGGEAGIAGEFLRLYARFTDVVVVNLHASPSRERTGMCIRRVLADGCALPFKSHSFDWVFSNAVIEHVGDFTRQRRFADEIRRVAATGYFVATPNRHFPIEPHTLLPFYQYLSPVQQRLVVRFAPGYMIEPLPVHLLSRRELHLLFPEARICEIGLPVFPNSLVAMHRFSREHLASLHNRVLRRA